MENKALMVGTAACAGLIALAGCATTVSDEAADSANSASPSSVDPNPITGVTTKVLGVTQQDPFDVTFTLKDGSTYHATCEISQGGSNFALGGGGCRYDTDPKFLQGQEWYGYQIENINGFDGQITNPVTLTIQAVGDSPDMETVIFDNNTCQADGRASVITCANGVVK